ncbi:RTA1 like protein-domain-containing protein [Hygrophoropsis aurantiaca]|uniref:RTA1 like protein-domain-containing protein n=1 Tax=Hygrophoropsis aurantiaca TaxID=72124 RepID=A0ACB8A8E9_9AGAM|nr:RTA1 like protein-domain-containing protein [Hygrophoropsis aurantiaca]
MSRIGRGFSLFFFSLFLCLATLSRADSSNSTSLSTNPYVDPKDDPNNPLKYIASNALTGTAFSLVLIVAFIHSYYIIRYGAIWMIVMVIGEYSYVTGFGFRFALHYHPDSSSIYIAEYLLIVLSPCMFIAANYMLLGRLARHLQCTHLIALPSRKLTIIFVSSDVSTFLIQAAGGVLNVSQNASTAMTGSRIFFAGLILQLVSFLSFSLITGWFIYQVHRKETAVWTQDEHRIWYRDWRSLAGALSVSCITILIRSGYRIAEIDQGLKNDAAGYLTTTEGYFYGLDFLPLFIAISVYVFFWPGKFIPKFYSLPLAGTETATALTNINKEDQSLPGHSQSSFSIDTSGAQ